MPPDPTNSQRPLGLIAGEGVFPFLVARGAKAVGRPVVCCGFDGMADASLADEVDVYRRVSIGRLTDWVRFFRRHHVTEAIMVGRVKKSEMYGRQHWLWVARQIPDLTTLGLYWRRVRRDRRTDRILQVVAEALEERGITLIDSTAYTPDHLADEGVMTRRQPTATELADIERGWEVCGHVTRLDVGQAVAVKDADIIAIEAVEGTNRMIERAGQLCPRGGWTLVKRANVRADMRLDVPSVGLQTVEKLREAKATCLCVEARKVILLEKSKVLELAERYGITVVGRA